MLGFGVNFNACGQLTQLIAEISNQVVDKNFTVTRPSKPQLRAAV